MSKRVFNKEAPLQSLRGASRLTGLSVSYLRDGCKANRIPHIMCGKEYRINMPLLMEQIELDAATSLRAETVQ